MGRLIRTLPSLCAVIVAAASFALSYVALRDVAARLDATPDYLAFLVPVVVDGGIIAGSAIIWESSRGAKRRHVFPYIFVGLLVIMSVVMNVAHAGPAPLAKVIAALPPLVLLGAIELVAAQHMREARQSAPVPAPAAAAAPPPWPAERPLTPATAAPPVSVAPPAVSAPTISVPGVVTRPADPVTAPAVSVAAPQQVPAAAAAGPVAAEQRPAAGVRPNVGQPDGDISTRPTGAPRRQLRTRAESPTESGPDGEDLQLPEVLFAAELPTSERVTELFKAHVEAGGSPEHPKLANAIAAQFDCTPSYVRKIIRPLRQALTPVTA